MTDANDPFPARVSRLDAYITRAFKYEKASILFAMYLSEFLRVEVENSLEKSLLGQGLKMVRVDAGANKDLPSFFTSQNPSNSVFLVHNLGNGFPEAIHYLNFKREELIEQKVKAVFWVREEELARITLEAPDFFAFRNRVVEFMDSPAEKEFEPALTAFAMETEYPSHTEIERSIALKEKLLSELSTETEISGYLLSSLATLYRTIGAYQKSIDYSEKALKIGLAVFGDKHPNVATEYNNIGEAWRMLGDAKKAIEYYNKALEIALAVFSDKHPKVATVYNNIGVAWSDLGDNEKAIKYYNKALEIGLAVLGDKHPQVAIRYNNIGEAWSNLGDVKKAVEYYNKALENVLAVFGNKHPNVAVVYNNLGEAWRRLGNVEKAIEYCNKALEIDLAVFGDKHPSVASDYNNLGLVWNNLGDTKKSIEYVTKALEIVQELYGVEHPSTKIAQKNLDALQRNLQTSNSITLIR